MKIKIITGYRDDQYHTIDAEEAHKAYYLFMNPEERGVFSNGVALIGKSIQAIEPDYHATMGWNKGYKLGADDYAQLRDTGVDRKLRDVLSVAKGLVARPDLLSLPLTQAATQSGLLLN
jgi:hypothetical protein